MKSFWAAKKTLLYGFYLISIIMFLYAASLPSTVYKLGNVFFGEYPKLYNVGLAQKLFTYASYPFHGAAPQFAHYQLSRTNFIQGKFDSSIAEALKELEYYPENKRTYYILGLTYGYVDKEEEAIEAFSKFIEYNPGSWAARNDKAWLQFRIGDIDGALETIEPVKEIQNPWVQNTYGTLLLNKRKYEEAEKVFLLAKNLVQNMTEQEWGVAYPGNDPRVYAAGLSGMKKSINQNLELTLSQIP